MVTYKEMGTYIIFEDKKAYNFTSTRNYAYHTLTFLQNGS